ncbi:hypothetical protein ACI2KD_15645 [Pseudomonas monteilii]
MSTCGSGLARDSGSRFAASSTLVYHWQTSACQGLLQASNDGKVSARGIASGPKALAYC